MTSEGVVWVSDRLGLGLGRTEQGYKTLNRLLEGLCYFSCGKELDGWKLYGEGLEIRIGLECIKRCVSMDLGLVRSCL